SYSLPRKANGAASAPVLVPVTILNEGRSPRALQPTSRPAPNAPSSCPPESAKRLLESFGHSRVSDCQISSFRASPSSPSKRALSMCTKETAPEPDGRASKRAVAAHPASPIAVPMARAQYALRSCDRAYSLIWSADYLHTLAIRGKGAGGARRCLGHQRATMPPLARSGRGGTPRSQALHGNRRSACLE